MDAAQILPLLLGLAVLLPLISFGVIVLVGPYMGKGGSMAAFLATSMIGTAFVLSIASFFVWIGGHPVVDAHHGPAAHDGEHAEGHDDGGREESEHEAGDASVAHDADEGEHGQDTAHTTAAAAYTGNWWTLGTFGKLTLSINYYIDALTVAMFCMVTLISTLIHVYAMGYMHEELHDVTDHEVTLENGEHLHRPGRYHRFFQYLSLFCFSMLGLVVSGNVAMTFVFWELVGICSYFLIGFYVERKSASTAANKAFIVNRVGDFGMIIGLMAIWTSLGTLNFGDVDDNPGVFSQVRSEESDFAIAVPDGMVRSGAYREVADTVRTEIAAGASEEQVEAAIAAEVPTWRDPEVSGRQGGYGYWLFVIAGVGIFCGCVGKSAQFPLQTWLPDAMEGPTPVSALVHSATMVAAGVFLVARFYPFFAPEVLLVIAITGTITLFMAATIAITATDIKRVLAYSTISQLGYMMLSLGVGGWLPGILHLFTHAFFKSMLFMCSGSVIHAVHTNEMTQMGGLRKKMPWTAYTMLIGCLAIAGLGLPFWVGLSGYYSKDTILEQAMSFQRWNSGWGSFFFISAVGGAAITSFYMFRLWFLTFAGQPRDQERYDHAHESPPTMFVPLVILAVFAVGVAWSPVDGLRGATVAAAIFAVLLFVSRTKSNDQRKPILVGLWISIGVFLVAGLLYFVAPEMALSNLLSQARPAGTAADQPAVLVNMTWPNEERSHAADIRLLVTGMAFGTAILGLFLAAAFYAWKKLDAEEVRGQFPAIYRFLVNKWWFDELYDMLFVRPTHVVSRWIAYFDRRWIDGFLDGLARQTRNFANVWDRVADRTLVDGLVNRLAEVTYSIGLSLRNVQTGRLRQYVMFIAAGTVAGFAVLTIVWRAFAG